MAKSKARKFADTIVGDGTLDGRDVSVDGTKLDGIETAADVTDTANVTAAGALMDSEVTNLAQVKAFDSSDYATSAQGTTADSALQNVVEDTSPQLGGNLDLNSNNITGTGNIDITGNLTTTGYIAGPATFTIDPAAVGDNTGTLVIAGNLQVDGTTTTINSTTMEVDDLNITLASGAANAAAANGAGITVDGASATITYDGTNDEWDFNKSINVTGTISSGAITANALIFGSGNSNASIYRSGSDGSGLHFTTNAIFPTTETGAVANGTEDLGGASNKFKDGYFGGTVNASTITSSGNVNSAGLTVTGNSFIGNSSTHDADARLHVASSSVLPDLSATTPANYTAFFTNSDGAYGTMFATYGNGLGEIQQRRINDTTTYSLALNPHGGNVGIGTDSPSEALHVVGKIYTSGTGGSGYFEGHRLILEGTSTYANIGGSAYQISNVTNEGLAFGRSSSRMMLLDTSGNLGIGTTSPNALLDLAGVTASSSPILRFTGTGNASQGDVIGQIEFYNSDETDNTAGIMGKIRAIAGPSGGEGSLQFLVDMPSEGADAATVALHLNANGNVGIGTTSPDQPLHVVGTRPLRLERSGVGEFEILIDNTVSGDSSDFVIEPVSGTNSAGFQVRTRNTAGSLIEALNVNHDGNVGIGTDSPASELHVKSSGTSSDTLTIENSTGNGSWRVKEGGSSNALLQGYNASNSEVIRLDPTSDTFFNGGNVGIGTSSPEAKLDVKTHLAITEEATANANSELFLYSRFSDGQRGYVILKCESLSSGSSDLAFRTRNNFVEGERMRINSSGNVGIGRTDPTQLLEVHKSTGGDQTVAKFSAHNYGDTGKTFIEIGTEYGDGSSRIGSFNDTGNNSVLVFDTHSATSGQFTERMRIDSSGNVGIGVVPESWFSSYSTLQIGASGALSAITSGNENVGLSSNTYLATDGNFKYIATNEATRYLQSAGVHYWYSAASGTADTNVSFSQNMTLDASGNLIVGGTVAGSLSGNNAMITMRRDSGNCGVSYQSGTAATDQWETYTNLGARFYIENTSTSNGAYLVYNSSSGWTSISDERWKTDWTLLEDSSSKITALNIGKYHMLNDSKESIEGARWDYGVKAQELLEVIPDAVDVPETPEDKYGVVPNIVFWHTVKALQEAIDKIESLEQRLNDAGL